MLNNPNNVIPCLYNVCMNTYEEMQNLKTAMHEYFLVSHADYENIDVNDPRFLVYALYFMFAQVTSEERLYLTKYFQKMLEDKVAKG